jgi:hypothetical protein
LGVFIKQDAYKKEKTPFHNRAFSKLVAGAGFASLDGWSADEAETCPTFA